MERADEVMAADTTITVPTLWLVLPIIAVVLGLYWWWVWNCLMPWFNDRVNRRLRRLAEQAGKWKS